MTQRTDQKAADSSQDGSGRALFSVELSRPDLLRTTVKTQSRMKWNEFIYRFAKGFPFCVLTMTPWVIAYRFDLVSLAIILITMTVILLGLLVVCARAYRRGPSLLAASLELERAFRLEGRLSAALSYAGAFGDQGEVREAESGYAHAAQQEICSIAKLSPRQAAPLIFQRGIYWGTAMASLLILLVALPFPEKESRLLPDVPSTESESELWVGKDDAELLRKASAKLEKTVTTEEGKEASRRFNEIVIQAVSGKISQAEAFQLAAKLEADLQNSSGQANSLHELIVSRGETLSKRAVTRKIGEALKTHRYKDAADALKRLSERLNASKESLSKKELDELRSAMNDVRAEAERKAVQEASEGNNSDARERELSSRRKALLQKKKDGSATKKELNELEKTERELAKLSRKKKKKKELTSKGRSQLSKLDHELAQAAQALQEQQKAKSGEFLDQAAETLSSEAARKLSDDEKRELIRQLKELKERLRRQSKEGKQAERLRKFQERARGGAKRKPGESQGQNKGPGSGKMGSKKTQVRLGPGGKPLPGSGDSAGESSGGPSSSKKPGNAHQPDVAGESSHLKDAKSQDVSAVAQDSGQGESASETIVSAAESGFRAGSYERLYREYETVAEEVMEKEKIPAGRKFHVARYFELIRPREPVAKTKEAK